MALEYERQLRREADLPRLSTTSEVMVMGELWSRDATDLAAMIASREVSAIELLDAQLDRVRQVNESVNAVVRTMDDSARERAADMDAMTARGESMGAFHGVPVSIKENLDIAGFPTTSGMLPLAEMNAAVNAPPVERILEAGAVPFARTNLPDMGLRLHTESGLHGTTLNPWNAHRTVGGSSGGEAVALATGMSPFGIGNDIGGSLRNPANCCGVTSIKPTTGVIPGAATIPLDLEPLSSQLMLSDGPMARRVRDVRAGLEALAGIHPRDPRSLPSSIISLDRPPADPSTVRIAVMAAPPGGDTDPRIAQVISDTAARLSDLGYLIDEQAPPRFDEISDVWSAVLQGDLAPTADLVMSLLSEPSVSFVSDALDSQPEATLGGFVSVLMTRAAIARDWSAFFTEWDLVLSPTWTQLPFELGWDIAEKGRTAETMRMARPVLPGNLLGLPSACVPAGFVEAMPVGALLTGNRFSERLCLDVAQSIEDGADVVTPIDPR